MDTLQSLYNDVDFSNKKFQTALFFIVFNPLYWNFGARLEYYTKLISTLCLGQKRVAVYVFSLTVFSLGLLRDELYRAALQEQKTSPLLDNALSKMLGAGAFTYGSALVLGSMYKLGIVGTYLGDHFGFLFDKRIVSFPFNICDNPMYDGSTLCFLGTALFYGKPAGLFATALVYAMYNIVLLIEEPFTAMIYRNKKD